MPTLKYTNKDHSHDEQETTCAYLYNLRLLPYQTDYNIYSFDLILWYTL